MTSSNILNLPFDLQPEILLKLSLTEFSRVCQTNSKLNAICKDERWWKRKFAELTGESVIDESKIPPELATTWFEKTRILWQLLHPKSIWSLTIEHTEPNTISLIKNYDLPSEDAVREMIAKDFNDKDVSVNRLMYYYMQWIIGNPMQIADDEDQAEFENWLRDARPIAKQILRGYRNMSSTDVQQLLSPVRWPIYDFRLAQTPLIELDSNVHHSYTIFNESGALVSVLSSNKLKVFALITIVLNYYDLLNDKHSYDGIQEFFKNLDLKFIRHDIKVYTLNDVLRIFIDETDYSDIDWTLSVGRLFKKIN